MRGTSTECPFCAAVIPARASDDGARAGVTAPRNRAQIMGFGVAVGTVAVATALMTSACVALYGAPAPDDADVRPDGASEDDAGAPAPMYGTPAP